MGGADEGGVPQRLVEAATEVLAAAEGAGMPLRAVAARAATTTGAIQHHFGDKQGLLLAVMQRHGQRTVLRLERLRTLEPSSTAAIIRAVLLEFLPLDDERREEALVALAFEHIAVQDEAMARAYHQQHTMLRHLLADQLPRGGADGAELLLAAVGGLRIDLLLGRITAERATELLDGLIERLV